MNEPEIQAVSVTFVQEGNTLGTTQDYESLTIGLEFQLSEEEGPFFVLKTEGWSFDNIGELEKLIKRCETILEKQ